jgi:hypothetical protein
MMAYTLKRWDNLYNEIIDNLKESPEGEQGKQIAQVGEF